MNATQLFPSVVCDSPFSLFTVNLPSMYRKLSHGNEYKSCCCILISSLCPRCVGVRIIRVSFNLDYAVENRLNNGGSPPMFKISAISDLFRTIKPNDFKNSTFVAESFFFNVLLSFLWIFLIVVSALKIVFCRFYLFIQYEISHMSSPYMQSNSDLLSAKTSNRPSWSAMRIVRSVR